jgi:hypothetical protein
VVSRIERCRTVDLPQNGVTETTRLLKALGRSRNVCLGVYADVVVSGRIAVNDPVVPAAATSVAASSAPDGFAVDPCRPYESAVL